MLESIASGVIANFVYTKLASSLPSQIRELAPAAFHGGQNLLREIDAEFQYVRIGLLKKYKNIKTLETFLSNETTIKSDVLHPLFDHIFLGSELDRNELVKNLISCREAGDSIIASSKTINGHSVDTIINELVDNLKLRFRQNGKLSNISLIIALDEIKNAIKTVTKTANLIDEKISAFSPNNDEVFIFANAYLESLRDYVKKLNINGLDAVTKKERVRHELQKSFVPLSVTPDGALKDYTVESNNSINWRGNAFEVINKVPRVILRGPAGCGKTTLLQWYLLNSSLSDEKRDTESIGLPVFIPLRRLENQEIEDWSIENIFFITLRSEILRKELPNNWLNKIYTNGYPLVFLFDGVDEISLAKRDGFWTMIAGLCEKFPKSKIIITSRHLSVIHLGNGCYRDNIFLTEEAFREAKLQWRPPIGFLEFIVSPLTNSEISDFVDKWHLGVDEELLPHAERDDIKLYPERLKAEIFGENHKHALDLCRSPLLCALVCMVHFLRNGRLPDSKRQLYELATKLLIETRDEHRSIHTDETFKRFKLKHRLELLQHVALTMQEGNESTNQEQTIEVPKKSVEKWIQDWLEKEVAINVNSTDLLNFLVERCSIIREPVNDVIDFIHRSFMEYLSANQIALKREPYSIRRKIREEQWWHTLQFCMDTSHGSYFSGEVLTEMYTFLEEEHPNDRDSFLKLTRLLRYCEQIPVKYKRTVEKISSKVLPPKSSSEVYDLSGIPYEYLTDLLSYENLTDVESRFYAGSLLAGHSDERCKKIILTGYERDKNRELIGLINSSGKISIAEHFALTRRLQNQSYQEIVFFSPDELAEKSVRSYVARKVGIKFPIIGNRFVGWDRLHLCHFAKLVEARETDWQKMITSAQKQRFDRCRILEIVNSAGFTLSDIDFLFPQLEDIEITQSNSFKLSGAVESKTLVRIVISSCSQPLMVNFDELPAGLEYLIFWQSAKPQFLGTKPENLIVRIEVDERETWEEQIYG